MEPWIVATGLIFAYLIATMVIGAVANRVRDNTIIYDELDEYLTKARVPYVAALREAMNYVRAYSRGLGVHELPEYLAWPDWDEWDPLASWLRSKRSQP